MFAAADAAPTDVSDGEVGDGVVWLHATTYSERNTNGVDFHMPTPSLVILTPPAGKVHGTPYRTKSNRLRA